MLKEIVIVIRRGQPFEKIFSQVSETAQRRGRIVFLMPDPPDRLEWFRDYLRAIDDPERALNYIRKIAAKYSSEEQKRLAEEKLSPLCQELRRKGIETAVELYVGSWRKAAKDYARSRVGVEIVVLRRAWERKLPVPWRFPIPSGPAT